MFELKTMQLSLFPLSRRGLHIGTTYARLYTLRFRLRRNMSTDNRSESPYDYTAGRWLYNEKEQNEQRYKRFDVEALTDVASEVLGSKCISILKGVEDSYNKVFFLEFENSKEAIARIPNPIAGPSRLITASEVATMDFALNVLQLPVPRILAWSGDKLHNYKSVDSDFIIMEVVPGIELNSRRREIKGDNEVLPHLQELFAIEDTFELISFSQHGSLYFKEDVSPELQKIPLFVGEVPDRLKAFSDKYRIGPISDRQWWRNERAAMTLDRGPWPNATSVFLAALKNQRKWIEQYAASSLDLRRPPYHPASYHLKLLDMAIQAVLHVLPPEELCSPTLWHPDLSVGNIHVSTTGVPHIEGIIDWQHTCVLPYFYQATIPPAVLSDDHPFDLIEPNNFDELGPDEQEDLRVRQRLFNRQMWYKKHILAKNAHRTKVVEGPIQDQLMSLLYCGQRTWFDSILELRQALLDIKGKWNEICPTATICPISFSEQEIAEHEQQWANFVLYQRTMSQIERHLYIEGDGWVFESEYSSIKDRLENIKKAWKHEDEDDYPFPYEDGRFSFFLT